MPSPQKYSQQKITPKIKLSDKSGAFATGGIAEKPCPLVASRFEAREYLDPQNIYETDNHQGNIPSLSFQHLPTQSSILVERVVSHHHHQEVRQSHETSLVACQLWSKSSNVGLKLYTYIQQSLGICPTEIHEITSRMSKQKKRNCFKPPLRP